VRELVVGIEGMAAEKVTVDLLFGARCEVCLGVFEFAMVH
jgi:hypothetical protein